MPQFHPKVAPRDFGGKVPVPYISGPNFYHLYLPLPLFALVVLVFDNHIAILQTIPTKMTSTVDAGGLSRAAQRKQRLLEIENEQRMEDVEALIMTEVRVIY